MERTQYILYAKYGYHIFDLVKTSKLLRLAGNVLKKKAEKNGKFCCRSCANSRTWNEEDKKRKSISVKKFIENNGHPGLGKSGWKHTDELKEIKRKLSLKLWDKIGRKTTEHFRIQNIINDTIKKEAGISSNWDYRRYLQKNASHIIKHNST